MQVYIRVGHLAIELDSGSYGGLLFITQLFRKIRTGSQKASEGSAIGASVHNFLLCFGGSLLVVIV